MSFPEYSDQTNFEFHLQNIKDLLDDTNLLKKIPNFPLSDPKQFYSRKDKQGWWMVTKQIVIRHYIDEYLTILGKENRNYINLYYIDLLSSVGMNKVSKRRGEDEFVFSGSPLSAALVSCGHKRGFKKIYANDIKLDERIILKQRLEAIKEYYDNNLEIEIDSKSINLDSNSWVIRILNEIKKSERYFNYLMIIDNQGLDIKYETIKEIRKIHNFGDIIITFQDAGIKRNLKQNPAKVEDFFGRNIPPSIKKEDLSAFYIKQLKKIGLDKVQKLKIASESGFYYTLLFCCRIGVEAKWLKMIEYYRNKRFKNWTDNDVKQMWDVVKGKIKPLTSF
ncbi:MAG: hypothetical protein ACFFD2_18355 [Promethearchaeota archaeon]